MTTLQRQARALGDPTRHRIFGYVLDATEPVSVAELTEHFGVNHNAIRQHLAKLVDADLVTERTAAPHGPGRPRLVYEIEPAVDGRWGAEGPYERLSLLLSEVISSGLTAHEVGRQAGRRQAVDGGNGETTIEAMADAAARQGFEPEVEQHAAGTDIVLHRCPFQAAAVADPNVICDLHLGLAEGMTDKQEFVRVGELVVKDPRRASCRLRLESVPASETDPR